MILFAALLLSASASGPENDVRELSAAGRPLPLEIRVDDHLAVTVGVWGRASFIEGTVLEAFPFDEDVTYGDLFDTGLGVRLEAGLLWSVDRRWRLGPFVTFGLDKFGGSRETDSAGDSIEPDDLQATSILAGFRGVYGEAAGFWGDVRASLGAVRWSDVDATFVVSGTPVGGVSFLNGETRAAFDLGVRGGYRAGPVSFGAGLGTWFAGGPGRGSDVTDVVDPSAVVGFYLELGLDVGF